MSTDLATRLRLASDNAKSWRRLVDESLQQARGVPTELVALWLGAETELSASAFELLGELEDQAVVPLISADPASPTAAVAALSAAVTAEISVRGRLHARLITALSDTRLVPDASELMPPEDRCIGRRVCDDAFCMLGLLQDGGAHNDVLLPRHDHFMRLPPLQRDALIERALQSGNFVRCLDVEDWAGPPDDDAL